MINDIQETSEDSKDVTSALEKSLQDLKLADEAEKRPKQKIFLEQAMELLQSEEGLSTLYKLAPLFEEAGLFKGGPWEDPSKLQVPLVGGSLRGPGLTPVVETLSELRILAIANGEDTPSSLTQEEAELFLDEVIARNLRYLFPSNDLTEAEREGEDSFRDSNQRLLELLVSERGVENILKEVVIEVEQVLAQRPISTLPVRRMITRANQLAEKEDLHCEDAKRLKNLLNAANGPTPLTLKRPSLSEYKKRIKEADEETIKKEAEVFASSMLDTGLSSPYHGAFVRFILKNYPELLPEALGTDEAGTVEIQQNKEIIFPLIEAGVFATTAQCLLGLSYALNRTLLSRPEVAAGLERLVDLEIDSVVEENLLAHRNDDDDVTANGALLAGAFAVLGLPLGVGQGANPTCQSARGISLWAQHDPAHLLELVVSGARDGRIEMLFQGHKVQSDVLPQGVAAKLDLDLDPVSIVIVPHLDRLYSEFMRRSSLRFEDAHKWVNPALYGRWVHYDLATAFVDVAQTTVTNFREFVRCFYSTHHPHYNGGLRLMYPNPVGLIITNHQGKYLGPHAVSIQRVDEGPDGEMRVYFFNPNNEGRQDWGQGVVATVQGHGELPGESSLSFEGFLARLYAFHYNPNEQGEVDKIPAALIEEVTSAAKNSWGENFIWA